MHHDYLIHMNDYIYITHTVYKNNRKVSFFDFFDHIRHLVKPEKSKFIACKSNFFDINNLIMISNTIFTVFWWTTKRKRKNVLFVGRITANFLLGIKRKVRRTNWQWYSIQKYFDFCISKKNLFPVQMMPLAIGYKVCRF